MCFLAARHLNERRLVFYPPIYNFLNRQKLMIFLGLPLEEELSLLCHLSYDT